MPAEPSVDEELRRATAAYQSGDLDSAERIIGRLLEIVPGRPDVQFAKGLVEIARGRHAAALDWLVKSLHVDPTSAPALAWATFASLHLQRFEEAEGFARKSTELDPLNARAHCLRAVALRGLNRIEEALEAVERSLAIRPDDAESLVTKARLLQEWQMPALAVETYRQALAIRPSPAAAVDLANILLKDSRPAEALEILAGVSAFVPEPMRPYADIAQAQTELHHFDLAEQNWILAERFGADRVHTVQRRAQAEIAAGRFGVAESLLGDVMGDDPGAAHSFFLLTTARKMTLADLPLAQRMEALAAKLPEGQEAVELHYGLGKAFDDVGDYERAIGHYDEANRIQFERFSEGSRFRFRAEDARAYTDAQIAYFTAERVRELEKAGHPSGLPLFVLGMPRSGTTLTSSILTAHSQVGGGGEYSFWPERVREYVAWDSGRIDIDWVRVAELARKYLRLLDPPTAGLTRMVDKNPDNFQHVAMLHGAFPNAQFVHLLRHPVDNVLSMWMIQFSGQGGYLSNRENLVLAYREHIRLLGHLRNVLPDDRFATFKYEDLTSRPDETIRSMLAYLNLSLESGCFAPEKNVQTVLTPSVLQVRQPIHAGSQARWKKYEPWLGAFAELLRE